MAVPAMTRAVVSLTSLILMVARTFGAPATEPKTVGADERLEVEEVVRQLQVPGPATKTRTIRKVRGSAASGASGLSLQVPFAYDSVELPVQSAAQLRALALGILALEPTARIQVIGHTDAVGQPAYNDELSLRRAAAVRDQLVQLGVPAARLEIAGLGSRQPKAGLTPEAPQNRRVEVLRQLEDAL